MKKLMLILAAMLFTGAMHAQVEIDDVDVESEEEEETTEVRVEDEISVTDQDGNEEIIEFPEAMTYDLDSLLNLYMSKTYLGKPGDCEMTNENPTYPREVYIERLQRIPSVMELAYNDIVQRFIDRYTGRLRYSVSYMLGALNFYLPIFEEALEAYQLPLELKYLPVIESALNPKAVSRAGAGGLWQFMPATAKQYGLTINSLVDERRDPVKSSYAAAHLLSDFYRMFDDWNLVIAAYNCGPGNINKAIHRSGKRDFWSIYPYLPRETRSYLPLFIAASYVLNYSDTHGICPAEVDRTMRSDTILTHRRLHLKQVSDMLGVPLDELRRLNPQYTRDIIPGGEKEYALCLPIELSGQYIDREESILAYQADSLINNRRAEIELLHKSGLNGSYTHGGVTYYQIKSGDSLSAIAKRFHVSVKQLRKWNNLKNDNIRAGKKLRIGG